MAPSAELEDELLERQPGLPPEGEHVEVRVGLEDQRAVELEEVHARQIDSGRSAREGIERSVSHAGELPRKIGPDFSEGKPGRSDDADGRAWMCTTMPDSMIPSIDRHIESGRIVVMLPRLARLAQCSAFVVAVAVLFAAGGCRSSGTKSH